MRKLLFWVLLMGSTLIVFAMSNEKLVGWIAFVQIFEFIEEVAWDLEGWGGFPTMLSLGL